MYITPWNIKIRDARGTLVYPKDTLLVLRGKNTGRTFTLNRRSIKIEPYFYKDKAFIQVKLSYSLGIWMDPDGFELRTPHPDNNSKPR